MFLDLNSPPPKPRRLRRTHVIDTGIGVARIRDQLAVSSQFVDLAKLGWGTSVITPRIDAKLDAYRDFDIDVCMGGTLFELAYLKGKVDEYRDWMTGLGVTAMEISDGTLEMEPADKLRQIEKFAPDFTVYSEVGSKDSNAVVAPARWVQQIKTELEAGAAKVILEGRESGTAGLYRPTGEIRMGLVEEITDAGVATDSLIFEAPNKPQQVWLLDALGPDLNLGNVQLDDVIALETLRQGLRSDTLLRFHAAE